MQPEFAALRQRRGAGRAERAGRGAGLRRGVLAHPAAQSPLSERGGRVFIGGEGPDATPADPQQRRGVRALRRCRQGREGRGTRQSDARLRLPKRLSAETGLPRRQRRASLPETPPFPSKTSEKDAALQTEDRQRLDRTGLWRHPDLPKHQLGTLRGCDSGSHRNQGSCGTDVKPSAAFTTCAKFGGWNSCGMTTRSLLNRCATRE